MNKFAIVLAAGLWICRCTPTYAQEPLFVPAPGSPITVGKGSGEIFLADINRDGQIDMVTKHLLQRSITMLLGDGKGHFAPMAGTPMTFGYPPGTIALGDVNHDKILDLGVTSRDDEKEHVHILLGNGRGAFMPVAGSPFTVNSSMKYYKPTLHLVDVNADGELDIVTSNGRRNTIEILVGDGHGEFSPGPVVKLESGKNFYSFAVGDADGDRHVDLVTASHVEGDVPASVVIKRGDGKGSFKDSLGSPLSVPPGARMGTLADLNGDQRVDLVLCHDANRLSVLLNQGDGMFTPAHDLPLDAKIQAFTVVVDDVNRDKKSDLIVATVNTKTAPFESGIVVLLGGDRGFAPAPGSPFRAGPGAYRLAVGDVNEDGKLDVAASSFEGNAITLLLGR